MSCGLMDFSPPLHGAGVELEFFIIPISTGFCGGFNMQMHTPAKLKNIFVKTLKRGTKI